MVKRSDIGDSVALSTSADAAAIEAAYRGQALAEYPRLVPSGAMTYSKGPERMPVGSPLEVVKAKGARVQAHGPDGRLGEYVDCVSALGAVVLGHCEPAVMEAVKVQLHLGTSHSLPTPIERALAGRLVEMVPGADMVRFGKNGCDVTGAAVRIARAATGRDRILYNGYHGHHDWSMGYPPMNAGVPLAMRNLNMKLSPETLDGMVVLKDVLWEEQPAALVLEPVPSASPLLPYDPERYFSRIAAICQECGVLLILDEMVTAFRLGIPGAITTWNIEADLWCGAKALGNGHPITALLGRRELMEHIDADVFYSTTFAGEATAMAAAWATLDYLERRGTPAPVGRQFTLGLQDAIGAYGLDLEVVGYDARPVISGPDALAFNEAMVKEGFLWQGYLNATWAHAGELPEMMVGVRNAAARVAAEKVGANGEG